jgi:hypothetical protein
MPVNENPIEKLRKAYRVLNVTEEASALAIKSSYRKLIKRWHPDKPATSAATADEAMTMSKLINEAYGLIENAPLRYYEERTPTEFLREVPHARKRGGRAPLTDAEAARIEKRMEYVVRIGSGVLSGAAVGLMFGVDLLQNNVEVFIAAIFSALLFGAAAVKVGDKLWREIFGLWWKWQ